MIIELSRRHVLLGGAGAAMLPASVLAEQIVDELRDIRTLKPGEFTWHPERSPAGPVAVIVSIPDQRVHVYRNGVRIGVSTCSTGKPGHATPTGVFTILQKDKHHRSSTYNNAPMPNMNRLTWDGVALHAGKLPGYPASHGCVRLPFEFSEKLFGVTHLGMPVIVAGAHSDPVEIVHPGLVLGLAADAELDAAVTKLKDAPLPTMVASSILLSAADRKAVLLENGRQVAEGPLALSGNATLGEHVFILLDAHDDGRGMVWRGIGHGAEAGQPAAVPQVGVLQRLSASRAFYEMVHARLHPGALLITTALPLHPDMRSGEDFVVMTA